MGGRGVPSQNHTFQPNRCVKCGLLPLMHSPDITSCTSVNMGDGKTNSARNSDMNRDHQTQRQPAYYKKNHLLALNLCAIYCVMVT